MFNSRRVVDTIKQLCKENNIKISDLENNLGLSKGNISRWTQSCPNAIKVLYDMADILNTSVDYILGTYVDQNTNNNKADTLNQLILNTKSRGVEWTKIESSKAKKIPIISYVNDSVYNTRTLAYETSYNDFHLIFVGDTFEDENQLYIESNNDYILASDNDSFAKQLRIAITDTNKNILNEFFSNNKEATD